MHLKTEHILFGFRVTGSADLTNSEYFDYVINSRNINWNG